jgi:hypothetical protein
VVFGPPKGTRRHALLAHAPTYTPSAPPTPTRTPTVSPGGLIGDVSCDGRINAIDAALVLQYDAGIISSLACVENADVNEDTRINSIDGALILQFTAGLVGSLPP